MVLERSKEKKGTRRREILRLLEFDVDSPSADIEECQSLQFTLGLSGKDEASCVIQSKEVECWITNSTKSSSLLINGNRPDAAMDDLSPMSLVSAELISLFSLSKSMVVISYFCGLHADFHSDSIDGVPAMMKSLIGQLLAQPKDRKLAFDLSTIKDDDIERIEEDDLDVLCKMFRRVVLQLPSDKILFCIIDGISRFETWPGTEGDILQVLKLLTNLVRKKTGVVIKLLFTCPGDSLSVGDGDEGIGKEVVVDNVLVVPDFVDGGKYDVWESDMIEDTISALMYL